MAKKESKLKIIPLGGLGEIGKNITVFEYKNDIVILDCGLSFPEEEMLGIDIVIPDINYLIKNQSKIRGVVITHGHEDHIGSVPYLLKKINVPVYASRLTIGLIENKLKEHKIKNASLNPIEGGAKIKLGTSFIAEFIPTSHSIPDSMAIAIHTPIGVVFHSGDFKVDFTPMKSNEIDLHRMAELGQEGVLMMLADSTNAEKPGYAMSEKTVGETFKNIFMQGKDKRIIIATFASNVHRVQQVITTAEEHGRKVVLSGRSMLNTVGVASELGYLDMQEGTIIDIDEMNNYPSEKLVLLTTGSQGEPMSALTRMAYSEHRKIELTSNDLVVISASPIPGNEKTISKVIDRLMETGIEVIYHSLADVHVSGHAYQEELKLLHSLIKPKYFMPVHGEYRHQRKHAKLAMDVGLDKDNIFIVKNGDVVELAENNVSITKTVQSGNVLVDGLGIGDVGNIVLRDRKHLSEDGLIVVVVTMSKKTGKVLSGPDIISRGFVYVRESEDLMDGARNVASEVLARCEEENITDWATLKFNIRDSLRGYIFSKIKRNPMILPIIMEV